jgi:hypothetical protein
MKTLVPFISSFFLPGAGQFILKDYKKGGLILLSEIGSIFLILYFDLFNLIPFWFPHIVIMIWAILTFTTKLKNEMGKNLQPDILHLVYLL